MFGSAQRVASVAFIDVVNLASVLIAARVGGSSKGRTLRRKKEAITRQGWYNGFSLTGDGHRRSSLLLGLCSDCAPNTSIRIRNVTESALRRRLVDLTRNHDKEEVT